MKTNHQNDSGDQLSFDFNPSKESVISENDFQTDNIIDFQFETKRIEANREIARLNGLLDDYQILKEN